MIESTPELWEMSDECLIGELSRNGWDWDDDAPSSTKKEIALIQEALRRILQHQIDESEKVVLNDLERDIVSGDIHTDVEVKMLASISNIMLHIDCGYIEVLPTGHITLTMKGVYYD